MKSAFLVDTKQVLISSRNPQVELEHDRQYFGILAWTVSYCLFKHIFADISSPNWDELPVSSVFSTPANAIYYFGDMRIICAIG